MLQLEDAQERCVITSERPRRLETVKFPSSVLFSTLLNSHSIESPQVQTVTFQQLDPSAPVFCPRLAV